MRAKRVPRAGEREVASCGRRGGGRRASGRCRRGRRCRRRRRSGGSRIPSSIASRVGSGRAAMARSSAVIGSRAPAHDRGTPRRGAATTAGRTLAVKLGLHIGYWGLGPDRAAAARARAGGRAARLRLACGPPRPTAPTPRRSSPGSRRRPTRSSSARRSSRCPARSRGDDRDDRGDDRPALRRADAARASARAGRRWPRAGTGSASPGSCSARASTSTVVRMALARERVEFHGETLRAAAARRAGQGAEAHDRAGAGADPDLHRRDRAEEHDAGRRDRRRLAADAVLPRARGRVPAAARGGLRARGRRQGLRRLRHRPDASP